jgi:hypothetical protein
MSYMLFEVWAEAEDGIEDLIETTASQSEAFKIAEQAIINGAVSATVFQETEDGDTIEIQRFEAE